MPANPPNVVVLPSAPPLRPAAVRTSVPSALIRPVSALPGIGKWERSLLAAYIMLLPVQIRMHDFLRLAPSDLLLAGLVVLEFSRRKIDRDWWSRWHVALAAVFMMGTINRIMTTGHLSTVVGLNKDIGLCVLVATYAVIYLAARRLDAVEWIQRVFIWSATLHALLAEVVLLMLGELTAGPFLINEGGARLSGMLVDPNAFGGLVTTALAFQLGNGSKGGGKVPGAPGAFCTVVLAMAVLLTYSRSAWVGVGCLVLILSMMQFARIARVAVVAALGIIVVLLVMGPGYTDVLVNMASRPDQIEARVHILDGAFLMYAAHPLLGAGLGMFGDANGVIIHNTFFWFLVEMGGVGAIALIGYLGSIFVKGFKARRNASPRGRQVLMALLLAHGVGIGLSIGIEAFYQRYWWMTMAMIAACASPRMFRDPLFLAQSFGPAPHRKSAQPR